MSVSFTPPAPAADRLAPAKADTKKSDVAGGKHDSRFEDDLREASDRAKAERARSQQSDERTTDGEAAVGSSIEIGFRTRFMDFSLTGGDVEVPPQAADISQSAPALPPSAADSHAAPAAPLPNVQPGATSQTPQAQILDGQAPAEIATSRPISATLAAEAKAPAQAEATRFSLTPETATVDGAGDETLAEFDLDLFTEQTLRAPNSETQTKAQAAAPTPRAMPAVMPLDQVAVNIARSASQGIDKIQIQLTPASLGRIDVEMELGHDGRVDAVVRVDKPETMELLQRDARQLVRALQDAGLQADSGSLSFQLRDQGGQQQDRPAGAGSYSMNDGRSRGSDGDTAEALPPPPVRRMALGGLDIIA